MIPSLIPRTAHSYFVNTLPAFVEWLIVHGFAKVPVKSEHEYYRLCDDAGRIVICYHSHSIVVAGIDQASTHQLLVPLCVPPLPTFEQELLPW